MGKRKPEKTVTVWNDDGASVELPIGVAKDMIRNDGKGEGVPAKKAGWTLKSPEVAAREAAAARAERSAKTAGDAHNIAQGGIGADPSPNVTKGLARLNELRTEASRLNITYDNTWGTKKLQEAIAAVKNNAGILPDGPTVNTGTGTEIDENFGADEEDGA